MAVTSSNAAVMAAIGGYLKEDWVSNAIRDQYARDTPLMALLEKNSQDVEGLEAVFTMRLGPNVSTAPRAELGTLPNPGRQLTKKCRVPLAYWYTIMTITGQSIAASKTNKGALTKVITDELDNAVKDHKKVENFYFFGDGSGFLAQISGSPAGNVITVDRWAPVFQVGRQLDSFTAKTAGTQHLNGATITAVNRAAKTVTVDAIGTGADGDYLFLYGSREVANMGLLGIVDNATYVSTFQGLSRATYPNLNAKVFGNSSVKRDISESLLTSMVARLREDSGHPDLLIGTSFQLNDLCMEATKDRRFLDPKKKVALGIDGIEIGDGVTFTFDADCPAGMCFALTKKNIAIIESAPLGFMDKDGNVLSRVHGQDAYEATLFHYFNLIGYSCYDHARIEDLNENRYGD